jgi:hypothetical protein
VANELSDQGSDGSSRQVPYDDIEANLADYYDISKYEKPFIRNPLRPDVDIMDLASIAVTLQKGGFDFYEHDVIQANILSHAKLVAQRAKELDDGDESASGINPNGDGNDLSRSSDGIPLSGEEAGKEEGEEVGRSCDGVIPTGSNGGEGEREGEEKRAGVDDEDMEADAESEGGRVGNNYNERKRKIDDGESMEAGTVGGGLREGEDRHPNTEDEGKRGSDDDDNMDNAESEGGREGDYCDERERKTDDDESMEAGTMKEGLREGEDQDPNTEDEGKGERDKIKGADAESIGEKEGATEDGEDKEEEEGGGGNEEVEGTIGAGSGGSITQKRQRGERKPTRGLQTRGSKRKAELEGVRTTRSKVPRLSVHVKQPVYPRRKGRHL